MNGVLAIRPPTPGWRGVLTWIRRPSDDEGVPPDDRLLVRGARRGSEEHAAALFNRHWRDAWRAAYAVTRSRALADDVAQDAFVRAFGRLDRFDDRRPFGPWLHRIVVNRAIDVMRVERRMVALDEGHEPSRDVIEPADDAALSALATIDPDRRAVVVLRHLLGYSPPEIADILGVPVGTVNSRLGRAIGDLRRILGEG